MVDRDLPCLATDAMEDCYFFMNKDCSKGSSCQFRHCRAAKTAKSVCPKWASPAGCSDYECPLRHSVFEVKIRNEIECFWESNGGCKKADCPFKHTIPRKVLGGDQVSEIALHTESEGRSVPIKVPPIVARHGSPVKRAPLRLPLSPDPLLVVDGKKTGVTTQQDLGFEVKSFEEIMREKRRRLDGQPKSPNPDVLSGEGSFSNSGVSQQEKPASDRRSVRGVESPEPEVTSASTSGDSIKASRSFMEIVEPVALDIESNPKLTVSDEEDLDIDRQLAELDELINS